MNLYQLPYCSTQQIDSFCLIQATGNKLSMKATKLLLKVTRLLSHVT